MLMFIELVPIDPLPLRLFVEAWIAMIIINIWFYIGYKIVERRRKR
ncbi:MAG: hypothetical protein QW794_01530 [Thermosphaera sp.]